MTEYERPGGGSDHGLTIEETSYEGEPVGKRREEEQEQWHREGAAVWDSSGSSELLVGRPGA